MPIRARISNVLPQFDPTTRTLKVRLDIDNPDMTLRPDMFVDVEIAATLPEAVTVPVGRGRGLRAAQDACSWIAAPGYFEPRRVETGWRADDRVEIVKGLMPGERIVVSGNFLLDSESRMKAAALGIVTAGDGSRLRDGGRSDEGDGGGPHGRASGDELLLLLGLVQGAVRREPREVRPGAESAGVAARSRWPDGVGAAVRGGAPVRGTARAVEGEDRAAGYVREADRELNTTSEAAGGRTIFATDPVCGAEVEMTAPDAIKTDYAGTTYYFVSAECKEAFDKDPARYALPPAAAAPR